MALRPSGCSADTMKKFAEPSETSGFPIKIKSCGRWAIGLARLLYKQLITKDLRWNHLAPNGTQFPTQESEWTLLPLNGLNFGCAGYKTGYKAFPFRQVPLDLWKEKLFSGVS